MQPKSHLFFETVAETEQLVGANGQGPSDRFAALMGSLLQAAMSIALLILLFYLIWGAFDWLTSSGDKGKLEAARNKMLHATVGIMLLAASISIFLFIQWFLGLSILNFSFGTGTP